MCGPHFNASQEYLDYIGWERGTQLRHYVTTPNTTRLWINIADEDLEHQDKEARNLQIVGITERAAVVTGLPDEQPRYYLQHALDFQVHDVRYPHLANRHGREDIGWKGSTK